MTDTPMTPDAALTRLRQYGERTSTWSTATYNDGTEKALHEIALTLAAEVDRLRAALSEATDQVAELESDLGGATAKSSSLEAELSDRAAENRELRRHTGRAADLVRRGRHEQADALLRALACHSDAS